METYIQRGFTLLELAVVITIVGLIAGGIVVGAALVRAAEVRSVIAEVEHFRTAVATFKEKYSQLPGDITNATRFWGAAHTTPASCPTATGTGTQTCNGDGDGIIEKVVAGGYNELYTFWQHLANEGLIEGKFSGKSGAASNAQVTEFNVPKSRLSGGVYVAYNVNTTITGSGTFFDGVWKKSYLQFAGFDAATGGSNDIPLLTPEELWGIDKKIDDGKPAKGHVIERHWADCTDASPDGSDLDADYKLTETGKVCLPIFYDMF
jgi:prepilin-type N-terminal cleavage/methylation domain-containing protein